MELKAIKLKAIKLKAIKLKAAELRATKKLKRPVRLLTLVAALTLLVSACAPRVGGSDAAPNTPPNTAPDSAQARATAETAEIAYHRMAIGFLQTGEYTTNALLELSLPKGVRWTLEDFGATGYRLRFTSSDVPQYAWLVTPQGVQVTNLN